MLSGIRPVPVSGHKNRPYHDQFSVNKVFRMEAEDFSFKIQVLVGLQPEKQLQKTLVCSGE